MHASPSQPSPVRYQRRIKQQGLGRRGFSALGLGLAFIALIAAAAIGAADIRRNTANVAAPNGSITLSSG
jgi:hypothetical protein